jgi:hypothetical protein
LAIQCVNEPNFSIEHYILGNERLSGEPLSFDAKDMAVVKRIARIVLSFWLSGNSSGRFST